MGKQRGLYVGSAILRQRVLELTIQGNSIRAVASIVGKSPTRVHQVLSSALDEFAAQSAKSTQQIVDVELARLDQLMFSHWAFRADPEHASVILKLMERRARLQGLDQPTQTEVGGFGKTPLIPPVFNIGFKNGGPGRTGDSGAEGS